MGKEKPKSASEINALIVEIRDGWNKEVDVAIQLKTRGVNGGFARYGKKQSEQQIRNASNARRGKKRTCETKEKMKLSATRRKASEETRKKLSQAHIGIRHSEETKKKISMARLGKPISEATKKRMVESAIERTAKLISVGGIIYRSVAEAAVALGVSRATIRNRVKSITEQWKDYFFVDKDRRH